MGALLLAAALILFAAAWEDSTRQYLKGFSDAIVPPLATPAQKVQAILSWMQDGPAREPGGEPPAGVSVFDRNPERSLNIEALRLNCGVAVNAFLNLANVSGVPARRLLLLDSQDTAKHVVAEVFLDGRWVVADPFYHVLLTGPGGEPLTRAQLADPAIFRQATARIPGYDPYFSYERTTHVRLAALPLAGRPLEEALDRLSPQWRDSFDLSLVLDRSSSAFLVLGILLFVPALLTSFCLWFVWQPSQNKVKPDGTLESLFRFRLGLPIHGISSTIMKIVR